VGRVSAAVKAHEERAVLEGLAPDAAVGFDEDSVERITKGFLDRERGSTRPREARTLTNYEAYWRQFAASMRTDEAKRGNSGTGAPRPTRLTVRDADMEVGAALAERLGMSTVVVQGSLTGPGGGRIRFDLLDVHEGVVYETRTRLRTASDIVDLVNLSNATQAAKLTLAVVLARSAPQDMMALMKQHGISLVWLGANGLVDPDGVLPDAAHQDSDA
jgi:hypothetical protein